MAEERLHKALAHAGVASRRRAEEMILEGRVQVNGEVVKELGTKVDPTHDVVQVDGQLLGKPEKPVYYVLNKPRGVLSSASDARGRQTVVDLVPHRSRLYPVGRLDLDSEGLVLLTNDGALALHLAHPRYEHEKEYRVLVEGVPTEETLQTLRKGIGIEGGITKPAKVDIERETESGAWLRIVLREGRKRQIRRMLEQVGYQVQRLIRVRMGPLHLDDLRPGAHRALTPAELDAVRGIRSQPARKRPVRRAYPEPTGRAGRPGRGRPTPAGGRAPTPARRGGKPARGKGPAPEGRGGTPAGGRGPAPQRRSGGTPAGRRPGRPAGQKRERRG